MREGARESPAPSAGYLRGLAARSLPERERERALVAAARAGDPEARGALIEAFLPLIASVARSYRASVDRVELVQEGVVGLLRAVERFDLDAGTPFWAYASWWVRQAMQQLVAELTRPVVLSDRALRQLARLRDAHRASLREHAREPSVSDLAADAGIEVEQVENLLAADASPRSLEEPVIGPDGAMGVFGELLADPLAEDEYERVLERVAGEELAGLLAGLSEREREILRARHGLDGPEQSLREVAGRLGLSAERVRQLEQRALAKLRA